MTPELQALARRAVACRRWRWMPGMRAVFLDGPPDSHNPARVVADDEGDGLLSADGCDAIPDLSDPATLGCLLALVRDSWGSSGISSGLYNAQMGQWSVYDQNGDHLLQPMEGDPPLFITEVAALVAALEAAP